MKTLSFIGGLLLMTFLFSCSSSNQLASSFGKRKYMKGHFSDPIASVKTKYRPASNIVAEPAPVSYANKMELPKVSDLLLSVANAKVSFTTVTRPLAVMCKKHTAAKGKAVILPFASTKSNPRTAVVANADETITTYHHGGEGSGSENHGGRTALYCLLLGLLCLLIAFGLGVGTEVFGIFVVFGVIYLIVGLAFLIIWLASMGGGS